MKTSDASTQTREDTNICACGAAPSSANGDAKLNLMYPLYNPYIHEHLFSTDTCERNYLIRIVWKDEGILGVVSMFGTEGGVCRLYNSTTGEHHYTSDTDELKRCVEMGWQNDVIMFYSEGSMGVVSMYDPYEKALYLHYTSNEDEIARMVKAGWRREEVKWPCSSRW